ncbi:unnamed protein product [Malassezia sympodialis ATCC 42132]|uniref:uncharacterized protein n=1 Tax=Malassezia sympodialis (strain ATCC 42132) TaxID=1230383 RepID=UPI0002C2404B|nr:uncharacterized protein MSY001_2880 [Malassezia sympodialis ATCC 42132]CCV00175.1 unnamed protein product [Malassezia sympodialis ATCC 42132]|eukprot:XP_018741382.1 uncharacterized protein MSY001_2880 [Malassezia sympodialis ATCC 42132]
MGPARGGRSRTVASRARWKVEDALDIIKRSRDEGYKRIVKGGIARLSFGPDGPGDDDDTFWVWDTEELLPNGGHMVAVRKATFDERWPYTGRRGWRPTSNKLSEAGFHFTPTDEDEDGCTCVYCGVELGGWERTDDPVYVKEANKRHEHQRRRPECPFFHCIVAEALQEDDTSKKRVTSSKDFDDESFEILPSKKRKTSAKPDIDEDEAQVESLVPSATEPPTSSFSSIPDIQDYLPYPFPHRHSSIDPPAVPDPHKMTVLEWITQQQNYLLDTMKERIERRLASMRQRNLEERKRLEKTLRS